MDLILKNSDRVNILLFLLFSFFHPFATAAFDGGSVGEQLVFIENKGQLKDTDGKPVPFVLYKASSSGMNVYLTDKGLTYMFIRMDEKMKFEDDGHSEEIEKQTEWISMTFKDGTIKKENITASVSESYVRNYFYPHCPDGIYGARLFERIEIRDIYPGIDWILYGSEAGGLKYDFILHPGSDPGQIRMIYDLAVLPSVNNRGDLQFTGHLGTLCENAPYSYYQGTNQEVPSRFVVNKIDAHHAEVSFDIRFNGKQTLVIDPTLWWGTLYGGSTDELDGPGTLHVDDSGNLLVVGYTTSPDFPVMDAGTYYNGVLVGGVYDLYIMKFTNEGELLWSTYYGGSGNERSVFEVPYITTDQSGNIFVAGQTYSADLPLQNAGTYFDSSFNGSLNFISDAFILKFDSAGNRQWATFFGGDQNDKAVSIATDPSGNLYMTGFTNSTIDFPLQSLGGAYNDSIFGGGTSDAFVAKFNGIGNLLWSTYFGGSAEDHGLTITSDSSGNIFLSGETASSDFPLQNNGNYYDATVGGTDAFISKFNTAGSLLWSTYLGGSAFNSVEWGISIRPDKYNNVFLMGYTSSTDFPLMNAGTYYDSIMGSPDMDIYITKFDNSGSMLWSTYFGEAGNVSTTWDFINYDHLETDTTGDVYISFNRGLDPLPTLDPGCGSYFSTAGRIAVAKFSNAGTFLWGSYLGNSSNEVRAPIAVDRYNCLFVGGEFNGYSSTAGLPLLDPGSGAYYSTTLGPSSANNHQAFQLKFIPDACSVVVNFTASDNHICPGACVDFINSTTGATSYLWSFPGGTPAISTDANPQNICYNTTGNFPVTLNASNATTGDTLTLNNYITVYPSPPPQSIIQSGDTLYAIAGANSYQWYYNGSLISGATEYFYIAGASGDFNFVATDVNGCEVEAVINNVIATVSPFSFGKGSGVKLFPNPVNDDLRIKFEGLEFNHREIKILNVLGEILLLQPITDESTTDILIDVSNLQRGLYLIEIAAGEITIRSRFIKS